MADEDKKKIGDPMMEDIESPHILRSVIIGLLAVAIVTIPLFFMFLTTKVEPWEKGLRYWNLNLLFKEKGEHDVLRPGYCLNIPKVNTFEKYDRSVQRLDLPVPDEASGEDDVLRIRTTDDNMEFDVYCTILYRIDSDQPQNIKRRYKTQQGIREQGVRAEFRGRLVSKLSEIPTAVEFYSDAQLVREKIRAAIAEMNELYVEEERGIKIDDVMIWDYKFPPEIEASIISKVIAIERIDMQRALTHAAEERAKLEEHLAAADAAYDEELARGRARSREIDAEAKAEFDKALARGKRKIMFARSEGLGNINAALAGRGGKTYVGLQYAEALKGVEILVLPASGTGGINPMELDQTIRQLQPQSGGGMAP